MVVALIHQEARQFPGNTPDIPSAAQVSGAFLMYIGSDYNTASAFTVPTGWTALYNQVTDNVARIVCYKFWVTGDPTDLDFTTSSVFPTKDAIAAFSGVSSDTPINDHADALSIDTVGEFLVPAIVVNTGGIAGFLGARRGNLTAILPSYLESQVVSSTDNFHRVSSCVDNTTGQGYPATLLTGLGSNTKWGVAYSLNGIDAGAPEILDPGTIAGDLVPGSPLTVTGSSFSIALTPTRQWTRDGADIPGATRATYIPTVGDVGTLIACHLTISNDEGSDTDTTPQVTIVPYEYQVEWDSYYKHASVTLLTPYTAITATSGLFQVRTNVWWGANAPDFYTEFTFPGGNLVNSFATIGITRFNGDSSSPFTLGIGSTAANYEMTFAKLNGGAASPDRFGDALLTAWDRSAGSTVRVAVSMARRKCWFGNPFGWDGDPEAGTGGFSLPDYERLCFHCTPRSQGTGTGEFEVVSKAAEFSFTPPTGFIPYSRVISTLERATPKAADDLVEMLGINLHLDRRNTDWATTIWYDDFFDLGIRYIRTGCGAQTATFDQMNEILDHPDSQVRGYLLHLATNNGGPGVYSTANITSFFNAVVANMDPADVIAFYGPNEPDITGTNANWAANAAVAQKFVYDTVKGNPTYQAKDVPSVALWQRGYNGQLALDEALKNLGVSMREVSTCTDGHYYTDGSRPSEGNTRERQ